MTLNQRLEYVIENNTKADLQILEGGRGASGFSKRQFRRNFQTDKQKKKKEKLSTGCYNPQPPLDPPLHIRYRAYIILHI